MEKFFAAILPSIEHFHLLGYWVAFFAALLETALGIGLLLPGSTFLLLLGGLTASGYLDFAGVWWFAVAGAIVGDNINYWLGQRYGNRWVRNGVWFLKPEHFEQARGFFDRHGAKSVFLGRFIPSVKEIAPFIAGTVGMRHRTFLLWNVLGAIGWGLQWVGAGYLFGQSLKLAQAWVSRAGMMLVVLLLAWVLLWVLQRFAVRQGRKLWQVVVSLGRSVLEALAGNVHVRQWMDRHPRGVRFLAARFDRAHFSGLPLTLLGLAFGYVLALFAGIVEDVVTSDPIVAVDHATAQLVAALRAPSVIPPFVWIANLGAPPLVGLLLVAACLLLWLLNRKYAMMGLLMSTLGGAVFLTLGKLAFQRPRPAEAVILESSYSFPSGHATIAVAFYGFLGYLVVRSASQWSARVKLFFATMGLVLLIGASRIVLGVHYLSDVWAGYLVGALWLIAGISVTEWLSAEGRIVWGVPSAGRRRMLALGLATVAGAGAIGYASTHQPPVRALAPEPVIQVNKPLVNLLQADTLPRTTTLLGAPEQPLAFAIVAPDEQTLVARVVRAGWLAADAPTPSTMLRMVREGFHYATAPVAPAFWRGRVNDLAFERPAQGPQGKVLATVRLWRTPFWLGSDRIFVGVARDYVGLRRDLLRAVSPDVDLATEQFVISLQASTPLAAACQQPLVAPMEGSWLMGDHFFTRGQLWLLDMRTGAQAAQLCATKGALP